MLNNRRAKTRRLSLGAMLVSLGTVLLYIGAVTDVLDLSLCAAASLIVVFALIEFGKAYAYTICAATAILSFLILPSKFASLMYLFASLYTIFKLYFEKPRRVISWLLKLLYFNAVMILCLLAAKYIFMLPDDGLAADIVLLLLGNAAFVLYDIAVSRLAVVYVFKLRKRFKLDRFLKGMR